MLQLLLLTNYDVAETPVLDNKVSDLTVFYLNVRRIRGGEKP